MNLHALLTERDAAARPIRIGLIGSGRFGTMYLAQARNTPGIHIAGIADINVARAQGAFDLVGRAGDYVDDVETALATGATAIVGDSAALFDADLDVIVEATGNPIVGIAHALRAIETGKHIIMVTVEADALAGPALAARAKAAMKSWWTMPFAAPWSRFAGPMTSRATRSAPGSSRPAPCRPTTARPATRWPSSRGCGCSSAPSAPAAARWTCSSGCNVPPTAR